jgi:hypothetical protein
VIVRLAKGYKLFAGGDRVPLEMVPEPVLRWPNPTREVPERATFVWTLDGRPVAIACVWKYGNLGHAFHSLSTGKLIAEYGGRTIWHPESPGIQFSPFPDAPRPAEAKTKRLAQMKELARRFSCRLADGDDRGESLRFLPRPLYRYESERHDIVDGALFAFVQGTDPEVILTLEAAGKDSDVAWRYALTRRSMLALEADLDGQRIWAVPHGAGKSGEVWYQDGIAPAE